MYEEVLDETILVTEEIIPETKHKVFAELKNEEIQEYMVEKIHK